MMLLYETEYLKIEQDESVPCLIITWRGFTTSEQFREGVDKILHHLEAQKAEKSITDLTEHRVISTEDQQYAAQASVNFDRTHWKIKRAIITPKDVFTRFGIKQVNAQIAKEEQQERRFFMNMDEARAWLKGEMTEDE